MIIVERGNVQLRIEPYELETYISMGYVEYKPVVKEIVEETTKPVEEEIVEETTKSKRK